MILFNVFVGDMDSRIEASSAISLTTLSCVVQSQAAGKGWIQRDLGRETLGEEHGAMVDENLPMSCEDL